MVTDTHGLGQVDGDRYAWTLRETGVGRPDEYIQNSTNRPERNRHVRLQDLLQSDPELSAKVCFPTSINLLHTATHQVPVLISCGGDFYP